MKANGGSGSKTMCHGRSVTILSFYIKMFYTFLKLIPPPPPRNSSKARYGKRISYRYCTVLVRQFVPEYLPELQFLRRALVRSEIFRIFRILSKLTGPGILPLTVSVVLWIRSGANGGPDTDSGSQTYADPLSGSCGHTLKSQKVKFLHYNILKVRNMSKNVLPKLKAFLKRRKSS
jgi:hypothetical protein